MYFLYEMFCNVLFLKGGRFNIYFILIKFCYICGDMIDGCVVNCDEVIVIMDDGMELNRIVLIVWVFE